MLNVFKRKGGDSDRNSGEGAVRHSRGWGELNKFLKSREGLRVLDFGSTSPANINYLTTLGHSVYMAHAVSDAAAPEWQKAVEGSSAEKVTGTQFDAERFCASNLTFSGRTFDVVLLWDTADYLPPSLVPIVFERLSEVLQAGGKLLAFFHPKNADAEAFFSRYQLTDSEDLTMLRSGSFPITGAYQTRQIEQFFRQFDDTRFFLGKDNVREVYATR